MTSTVRCVSVLAMQTTALCMQKKTGVHCRMPASSCKATTRRWMQSEACASKARKMTDHHRKNEKAEHRGYVMRMLMYTAASVSKRERDGNRDGNGDRALTIQSK